MMISCQTCGLLNISTSYLSSVWYLHTAGNFITTRL